MKTLPHFLLAFLAAWPLAGFACAPAGEGAGRDAAPADWCAEHGVPESQCVQCGAPPPADAAAPAAAEPPAPFASVVASPGPRAQRPPESDCDKSDLLVVLRAPEEARAAGIEIGEVVARELAPELERTAVLAYDADRHVLLGARAAGTVARVLVDLGQEVAAGEELLLVESAALGAAHAALLREQALVELWRRDRDREAGLLAAGAGTERQALEAESRLAEAEIALAAARLQLRNLGLDEAAIARAAAAGEPSSLLPVVAPFAGTIVARRAALGQAVAAGEPVLEVADLGRLWARIDLREEDAGLLAAGRPLVLEVDALPGQRWPGRLDWIGAELDPRSRSLPARAAIENPDRRLRAGMFGHARIEARAPGPVVLVPCDAVQWEGCCNVVFVPEGAASFRPRPVRLGEAAGDHYVVLAGLAAGERVVTTGAFLLKTEILKGSIGAGCCEEAGGDR